MFRKQDITKSTMKRENGMFREGRTDVSIWQMKKVMKELQICYRRGHSIHLLPDEKDCEVKPGSSWGRDILMLLTVRTVSIIYGCRSSTKTFSLSSSVLITKETREMKRLRLWINAAFLLSETFKLKIVTFFFILKKENLYLAPPGGWVIA